jgi:UDP-N-acetylmuramoyl-tripeptide--D-alanyl-D-alanine ligase
MIAALDLLASLPGRRKIAILGEMLELGDAAETEHSRVERYARELADMVMAIGGPYRSAEDRQAITRELPDRLQPGDLVLIKGSRGAAMDELLPVLEEAARRMKEPVA